MQPDDESAPLSYLSVNAWPPQQINELKNFRDELDLMREL